MSHGFLRAPDGTITTFDPPGSIYTVSNSINNKGAIAGYYTAVGGMDHGFVRAADGTFATIDPPGSVRTVATGIGKGNAIAGNYYDGSQRHGFVRSR